VFVYNSSGVQVTNQASATGLTLNLPNLAAGTYTVLVIPALPLTGSVQLTLVPQTGGALSPIVSGSGASYTTVAGQYAYFSFSANAGDNVSFAMTNFSLTPTSASTMATVLFYQPNGVNLTYGNCLNNQGRCEFHLRNLPQTGTYTIIVQPGGQAAMSFVATLSQDVTGSLAPGTPSTINLPAMGQSASLTFSLSSQQTVAVNLASISTSPANSTVYLYVYNSSGAVVTNQGTTTGVTLNLPNLAAGTYTVVVTPAYPATGSMQVTLEPQTGGALSPTASGSGASYTTPVVGQNGYFSFSANAGDNVSFAMTNFSITPTSASTSATVLFYQPNGVNFTYNNCNNTQGSCEFHLRNLPQTGTYTVIVQPGGQATMSFVATLSQDVTGSLASGTPSTINLAATGQSATFTFATTATQSIALTVSSVGISPSTTLYVYVYNASGTSVGNTSTTTGTTLNLTNLPAGTYTVLITPWFPTTGSLQLSYH